MKQITENSDACEHVDRPELGFFRRWIVPVRVVRIDGSSATVRSHGTGEARVVSLDTLTATSAESPKAYGHYVG